METEDQYDNEEFNDKEEEVPNPEENENREQPEENPENPEENENREQPEENPEENKENEENENKENANEEEEKKENESSIKAPSIKIEQEESDPNDIVTLIKSIKPNPDSKVFNINTDLYEHLKKLYLSSCDINDTEKFYDLLEDISLRVRLTGKYEKNENEKNVDNNFVETLMKAYNMEKDIIIPKPPAQPTEEGGGEAAAEQPIQTVNFIPDYYELFQKFSHCGLTLPKKELILLQKSLYKLAATLPNGNISFFGKIFGTEKDYYIVEATEIDAPEGFNYDADMEKRKEDGINRNVFFVTNSLYENKWTELPDIKPSQIKQSRLIKYIFTGNLENKIYSNPTFDGVEKHYLRCIIARIYHGTKLVPNINHYVIEDPENPYKQLTPAEKLKPFTYNELINNKNWIHYPPSILNNGRVSHIIEDPPEGIEPEDWRKKKIAEDPFEKRMKSISEDKQLFITGKKSVIPWKISVGYDDNIVYINPYIKLLDETQPDFDPNEQKDNKVFYNMVFIRSLRWPGAVNIYNNKENYFFYFGNGLKYLDYEEDTYVYNEFPTIPEDPEEKEAQAEPHVIEEEVTPTEEGKVPEEGKTPEEGKAPEGEEKPPEENAA